MYDDRDAAPPTLFGRATPPKDAPTPEPKHTGGLFDRITPPKEESRPAGLFGGDQTWTPDKGLNFAPAPFTGSSLFSDPATAKSSSSTSGNLFGGAANGTSSTNSAGLFGSKPSSTAATPSAVTSAETSEAEASTPKEGEPSDAQPPEVPEHDLSGPGPGEEDEDSFFQARSIIYRMAEGKLNKEGVGSLRVLKNRVNGKGRIVVRSDIGKVVMNVALSKDIKYSLQDKRLLRVPEFFEGGRMRMWAARIGKEDVAAKLLKTVDEIKGGSL